VYLVFRSYNQSKKASDVYLNYKTKAVKFWRTPTVSGKKRKFAVVKKKFKRLKEPRDLYRWAKHVDASGSRTDKWEEIRKSTFQEFEKAIEIGGSIHDVDIQQWAMEAAVQVGLPDFKACNTWVSKFKTMNRIWSRKITKLVSRANLEKQGGLQEKAEAFVSEVKPLIEKLGKAV